MQYRELGTSGITASTIGLGTWAIGGWMWGGVEEHDAIRAIHAAIDAGVTLIDTAPAYGFGHSETIIGQAIRDRRDQVVLASKCGLVWRQAAGEFFFTSSEASISSFDEQDQSASRKVYRCLTPEAIRADVEDSLQRLGVDHIDLMQTHWQDGSTPIAESMHTLMQLKAEGKIRAIGCSNASPEQMDQYRAAGQLDVDQEQYSMLDRQAESSQLPYCQQHRIAFLAYSSLAQGLLSGRMAPERVFPVGDLRRDNPRFSVANRQRMQQLLADFQPIADTHGISLSHLALAWTLQQPGCSHALVGARNPAQALENAGAGSVQLSSDELARMQALLEHHVTTMDQPA
jgi:methylglyoxal reductase